MAELESKQTLPRSEIAEYLHEFADELETDRSDDDLGRSDGDPGRSDDDPGRSDDERNRLDDDHDATTGVHESANERGERTDDAHSPDEPIEGSDRERGDPETGERLPPQGDETTAEDADATHRDATTPDDRVTLIVGDDSATVNPPETADFEIEVDSDSSLVGNSEQQRVTFELEWEVEEVTDENEIEIT